MEWGSIPVYPGGRQAFALDVMQNHYQHHQADLLITLMDVWVLNPAQMQGMNIAHWIPIDCEPLGAADRAVLDEGKGRPIAISRHGEKMLKDAGFDALYVPHSIDTQLFAPPPERDAVREAMGLKDRFVIGINGANIDHHRKAYPEQFLAFAKFRKKHPEALLVVHALADNREFGGLDLWRLAQECGISDAVKYADQYALLSGRMLDPAMAHWYGMLDLLSCCSWAEGFGLPILEAQSCGTPVVTTRAASMPELTGAGWSVEGEPFWNITHAAWWQKPTVAGIARAYEKAYEQASRKREQARAFALQYDSKRILEEYWVPALAELEAGI